MIEHFSVPIKGGGMLPELDGTVNPLESLHLNNHQLLSREIQLFLNDDQFLREGHSPSPETIRAALKYAKRIDAAVEHLEFFASSQPPDAEDLLLLNHILPRENNIDLALSFYDVAHGAGMNPRLLSKGPGLSIVIEDSVVTPGQCAISKEEPPPALDLKEEDILRRRHAFIFTARGLGHDQSSEEAFSEFERARELAPDDSFVYCAHALRFSHLKDYESAIECLNRALELESDRWDIFYNRAVNYLNTGELDKALVDASRAVELHPSADTFQFRAAVYMRMERYSDAVGDCENAVRCSPSSPDAYDLMASACIQMERYWEALRAANTAIKLGPEVCDYFLTRGHIFFAMGRNQNAIHDLKWTLELDPDYWMSYRSLGYIYLEWRLYEEAIAYLDDAVRLNPENEFNYTLRASALRALGYIARAEEDEHKAEEIENRSPQGGVR